MNNRNKNLISFLITLIFFILVFLVLRIHSSQPLVQTGSSLLTPKSIHEEVTMPKMESPDKYSSNFEIPKDEVNTNHGTSAFLSMYGQSNPVFPGISFNYLPQYQTEANFRTTCGTECAQPPILQSINVMKPMKDYRLVIDYIYFYPGSTSQFNEDNISKYIDTQTFGDNTFNVYSSNHGFIYSTPINDHLTLVINHTQSHDDPLIIDLSSIKFLNNTQPNIDPLKITKKIETEFGVITIPEGWKANPNYYKGGIYGYTIAPVTSQFPYDYFVGIGGIQATCDQFPSEQGYYCKEEKDSLPIFTANPELNSLVDSLSLELK